MVRGPVLAGGEGTRLRPLSLSLPKHLAPLLGRTVIEYPIQYLAVTSVRDIGVVAVAWII